MKRDIKIELNDILFSGITVIDLPVNITNETIDKMVDYIYNDLENYYNITENGYIATMKYLNILYNKLD